MRTKILQMILVFAAALMTKASAQSVTPFYENGVAGYKDATTGQVVIPARYRSASYMMPYGTNGDYYAVLSLEGKFGCIKQNGEVLIPFMYEFMDKLTEGVARVKLNGKYGYININNETVIPFEYDYAGKVSQGMARVQKNGMWGFINMSTKVVTPLQYSQANDYSEGLASVQNANNQWGFIDLNGNYVIAPQYIKADKFINGQALVHNGSEYLQINTSGQVVGNPNHTH
jgi:hypothetical protein